MQIGQTEPLSPVDEDRVHRGNVDPALDDGRGYQHVSLAAREGVHHAFQLVVLHPAVGVDHTGFRYDLPHGVRHRGDGLNEVVHEVDLSVTVHFPKDRITNQPEVEGAHLRGDGAAVDRRRLQRADIAHADHRHVQRPWNRRRRQREHIHRLTHRLKPLLVLHAEALFLVDHHQPEVGKPDFLP